MSVGKQLNQSSSRGNSRRSRPANKRRSRRTRRQGSGPRETEYPLITHTPKRYGVVFFKKIAEAKADLEALLAKAKEVDQLNIVIRAEPEGIDDELAQYGKVFEGEAWTLIHERRLEDGWYDKPQ